MRCIRVALLVLVPSLASAGDALDKPAFTASPDELLAAAKQVPPGNDSVVVLRHDTDISFDDRGLATERRRWMFVITSDDDIDGWDNVWQAWRPWNESRPTVRARVIAPSGKVTQLDPSKLAEQPAEHGDLHELSGPLPALQPGCIVEEEIAIADTAPSPGGRSQYVEVAGDGLVTLSAPAALKARVVERGLPPKLAPRHTVSGGRETWTYTFVHHVAASREPGAPEDVYTWPLIAITTAPSWGAVAKAYATAVEPHLAITLPPELKPGATRENAAAITAWLHTHVTYTDADLASSRIDNLDLPAVLKRGTANANEQAALLTALLRAAGFTPELVLTHHGWQASFDRDRPTLSSFDHVVVRVPLASGELWIDPLDRDAPVGQLDAYDQGSLALAVTRGALVTVPSTPEANVIREVRTFTLATMGRAKLREVSHDGGAFESDQRSWAREHAGADQKKQFERYITDAYDGTLDGYTTTPPEDLTKPFEITLDIGHTGRANTEWTKAEVYLRPAATFNHLPVALTSKDADARTHDLVIRVPHVYEIENRIIVPDGFALPTPAADHTRAMGPMKFIERQRVDGRTLIVTYRLEALATRLTPGQVTDAREAIADIRRRDAHVVFANTGWALIDKGKFREGLAELDRMIAAEPASAIHRARRAQALILVGAGDAARREARKAVELDPKSADAYAALGWVLTHDHAGRRWAPGYDRAGARAAFEQARKLNPKHSGAASELAEVLERDARGYKYDVGSDLHAAAEAWRAANTLDPDENNGFGLVRALFFGGDAAGAEKAAKELPASHTRDVLLVAAIAVTRGADAAIAAAPTAGREHVLQGAASMLMYARKYDLMRRMYAEVNRDASSMTQLQRFDAPFKLTADPKDLALAFVIDAATVAKPRGPFWDAKVEKDMTRTARSLKTRPETMTSAVLADLARSMANVHVDGDKNAWRITVDMQGHKLILYAAFDRGSPKIIGGPYALAGVGAHVLRLIGKHDDAALRLLDWVVQDVPDRDIAKLWGGSLPRNVDTVTLAATELVDDPDREVTLGTKCGATTPEGQLVCDHMVARGYREQGKWDALLGFATAWAARAPASLDPIHEQVTALAHLGRAEEAEHALDAAIAKHPDEPRLLAERAEVGLGRVPAKEMIDRLDAVVAAKPTDGGWLNNVAWMKMAANVDLSGALYDARKAVESEKLSSGAANTLAAIEAEHGDLRDAVVEIHRSSELARGEEPPDGDWYVLGRIYELAGLREDAIAAYQRVPYHKSADLIPHTDGLAAARLQALGVKR